LRQIVEAIKTNQKVWKKSIVIVTYDENGGLWDHVSPPKVDQWGPGTRIPAIIISPYSKRGFIDHTPYDTTSILKLIEHRYELKALSDRDKNANELKVISR
ncbi:MAG: alkaline phosphatase family protein, partial [Sulfuricurvum sp.]|nr:alkaline phosphatase family protein [Sulfuricurvum sp.]